MKVQDLERLKLDDAIWGYEVLAETNAGDVSEVRLVLPTSTNLSWYKDLLNIVYKKRRQAQTGLGNAKKGQNSRANYR